MIVIKIVTTLYLSRIILIITIRIHAKQINGLTDKQLIIGARNLKEE